MLRNVEIICFAGSYAVVLALEVSRLLFRSGVRGAVMLLFAGAGLLAHSAFLYHRALKPTGSPLSSERDWYLLAAWALVVVYLYLVYYHPRNAFGLFLLPLVLGLVGAGAFADDVAFDQGRASKVWGAIHGASILLATVAMLIGFAAGLMYLAEARRLKHKRPPIRGLRLPSLEWLQRANSRAIVVSVLTLGVGVLSGVILSRVRAAGLSWGDPVVFSTTAMFAWLLIAFGGGALYRPAREGRKVAYMTVVSFVFLLMVLGVVLDRHHGRGDESGRRKAEGARVQGPGVRGEGLGARGQGPGMRGDGLGARGEGPAVRGEGRGARGQGPGARILTCGLISGLQDTGHLSPLTPRPLPLAPHPSSLAPHPSSLAPHPSSLAPHPSSLAPHPSSLTPDPWPLTPRFSPRGGLG